MKDNGSDYDWLDDWAGEEREQVDGWSGLSPLEQAEIQRLDAEVLGLLPYSLAPVEPSAGTKRALLEQAAASAAPAPVVAFEARPQAPRWLLPLAAGLTVVALGAAGLLFGTVRDQRLQLAGLEERVESLSRQTETYRRIEAGLEHAQENLRLVSSTGVEVCPLRPMAADSEGPDLPNGVMFLASDHQHWYLRTNGLEAGPGRYYRVWFRTEDGYVAAGNLEGDELELGAPTMPVGTNAVRVTLEADPEPAAPSDEIVLLGEAAEMIRIF